MLFRLLRILATPLLKCLYGYRVHGAANLDGKGPMLLTPNHVSWVDWLFVGLALDDSWRFVTSRTSAEISWFHRIVMINRRTFPVDPTSAYAVRDMAEHLQAGGVDPHGALVCVHKQVRHGQPPQDAVFIFPVVFKSLPQVFKICKKRSK